MQATQLLLHVEKHYEHHAETGLEITRHLTKHVSIALLVITSDLACAQAGWKTHERSSDITRLPKHAAEGKKCPF